MPKEDQVHVISQFEPSGHRLTTEIPTIYGEAKRRPECYESRHGTPRPLWNIG